MVTIQTPRLRLRYWTPQDAPRLAQIANNHKIWLNLKDRFPHPYTDEAARFWVSAGAFEPHQHNFAIEEGGEVIGGIGLHGHDDVYRKVASVGYWLAEGHWGKGFAVEAVKGITAWGFETLGLQRIQAGVYEWNPPSGRVLEKAGYHLEAKLKRSAFKDGKVIDQFLYVCLA